MIYFDNAATTYCYPETLNLINNVLAKHWGNPMTLYKFGAEASKMMEEAREKIAKSINAEPCEIIFTSCASESNALAINQRKRCVCSPYCHHDIRDNEKTTVVGTDYLQRVDKTVEGWDAIDLYENYIYVDTYVANETGQIFDLNEKIRLAHKYNMLVLVDCTQALGNIPVDAKEIGADFLSFSAHKVHGPKYCGWLWVRKELLPTMKPLVYGSQEQGIRGGTSNTAFNIASGLSVEMALAEMEEKNAHCKLLRQTITDRLVKNGVPFIINQGENNIPSILSISFQGITGEGLMLALDSKDIYVGTGAACSTGLMEPSLTLQTMGVADEFINGTIRVSMSLKNTIEDAEMLADSITEIVKGV